MLNAAHVGEKEKAVSSGNWCLWSRAHLRGQSAFNSVASQLSALSLLSKQTSSGSLPHGASQHYDPGGFSPYPWLPNKWAPDLCFCVTLCTLQPALLTPAKVSVITKPSAYFPALSIPSPGSEAGLWLAPVHGLLSSCIPGTKCWNKVEVAT